MTRDEAIEIARAAAKANQPSYYAEPFQPHEWVVDAILTAANTKPTARHYPPGMQAESQRLHREYNALVAAQRAGAKNGAEVVKLTDECNAKGIILVPGGENL